VLVRNFLRADDFVARYGGEEFAVLIADSDLTRVRPRADRVREAVASLGLRHTADSVPVSLSVGVSGLLPGGGADAWLNRADRALYAAKAAGGDRVEVG